MKFTFKGGIHPYEGKELTMEKEVKEYIPKGDMVYPLSQHIGAPAKPVVKKGDRVLVGQKIAEAGGFVSANIHSAISGTVKNIESRMTANGTKVQSFVVENDGLFEEMDFSKNIKPLDQMYREDVKEAMNESLKKLRLDYVDLYLMHWPVAQKKESIMPLEDEDMLFISDAPIIDTWKEMEELYRLGKAKAIGVANFGVKRLEKLINEAEINPMVNQVESHPYLKQNELLEFLRNNNIVMTAYAPIGSGDKKIVEDKIIKEIAQKNNVSEYQVCLAWNINRGVVVIPKSENVEHLRENLGALNVMLDEGDMKKIDKIDKNERVLTADVFKIGPYKDEDIFA